MLLDKMKIEGKKIKIKYYKLLTLGKSFGFYSRRVFFLQIVDKNKNKTVKGDKKRKFMIKYIQFGVSSLRIGWKEEKKKQTIS